MIDLKIKAIIFTILFTVVGGYIMYLKTSNNSLQSNIFNLQRDKVVLESNIEIRLIEKELDDIIDNAKIERQKEKIQEIDSGIDSTVGKHRIEF